MKKVTLLRLDVTNFKGLDKYVFIPDGQNKDLAGINKAGKTRLFDAYLWLTDGRDSLDQAEFDIKKRLPDFSEVHNVDTTVEAVLFFEGDGPSEKVCLKKTYYEQWTKKHGSNRKEFTGNKHKYWFDEVPVSQSEFKKRLDSLFDAEVFRLVSDPMYFASLHWQKQRDIFMDAFGDVDDDELIQADKALEGVKEVLGKLSTDEKKKALGDIMRRINQELKEIPARIDELTKQKKPVEAIDLIQGELAGIRAKLEEEETGLQALKSGSGTSALEEEVLAVKRKIKALDDDWTEKREDLIKSSEEVLKKAKKDLEDHQLSLDSLKTSVNVNQDRLKRLEKENQELNAEWKTVFSEKAQVDDSIEKVCFNCGQDLPEGMVSKAREKALAHYESVKNNRLANIEEAGKDNEKKRRKLEETLEADALGVDSLEKEIEKARDAVRLAESANAETEALPLETDRTDEREALVTELGKLEADLDQAVKGQPNLEPITDRIKALKQDEEGALNRLSDQRRNLELDERINYLTGQEAGLAKDYEKAEAHLNLINRLVVARSNKLTERINQAFKITKFKLFEEQINEGIRETFVICDADGVPYRSTNSAARRLCGIDIINVISKHLGYCAPIWIDNAESITDFLVLPELAQYFRLFADPEKKELITI